MPLPSTSLPESGASSPARIRSRVVLPAPFRPARVIRSPASSLKETSANSGLPPTNTSSAVAVAIAIVSDKVPTSCGTERTWRHGRNRRAPTRMPSREPKRDRRLCPLRGWGPPAGGPDVRCRGGGPRRRGRWIRLARHPRADRGGDAGGRDAFPVHELAIEDASSSHQRAKLEDYEDHYFVVLRTALYDDDKEQVEFGEIHIFAGPGTRSRSATARRASWPRLAPGSRPDRSW